MDIFPDCMFIQPDKVERVIGDLPDVSEVSVFGIPAGSGAPGESDLLAAIVLFPARNLIQQRYSNVVAKVWRQTAFPAISYSLKRYPRPSGKNPRRGS